MAAQRIAEDEYTVTYQTDDGRIVRTGRDQAAMLGDDFGMTQPPSAMGNNAPEPQPSIATGAPDLTAMQRDPTAPDPAAAAPPIAPPAPQVHGSPPEPPAVTPAAPAPGPEAVAPTSPSAEPVTPRAMPQNLGDVGRFPPLTREGVAELEEAAIFQKTRADMAKNEATADAMEEANAKAKELAAAREIERQKEQEEQQALASKHTAAIEAADNHKIDRGNYWESRSTGQKVLAGIGVALAGLGMAMKGQGGKNPALDMIFKAIDDDVKDQMHRGDQLGKAVARSRGLMETHGQLAKTAEGRYNAMMAGALEATARDVEAIAARSANKQVQANALGLVAGVREKYIGHKENFIKGEIENDREERKFEEQQRHARASEANARSANARQRDALAFQKEKWGQEFEYEKTKDQADREAELAKAQGKTVVGSIYSPSSGTPIGVSRFGANDPKEAIKEQKQFDTHWNYTTKLRELQSLLEDAGRLYHGPGSDSAFSKSDVRAEIDARRSELATMKARLDDPESTIREGELENAMKKIPGGQSWTQRSDPKKLIDLQIQIANDSIDTFAKSRGIHGTEGYKKYIDDTKAHNDLIKAQGPSKTAAELAVEETAHPVSEETDLFNSPLAAGSDKKRQRAAAQKLVKASVQSPQGAAFLRDRIKDGSPELTKVILDAANTGIEVQERIDLYAEMYKDPATPNDAKAMLQKELDTLSKRPGMVGEYARTKYGAEK